jgi:hypothetical protein
MKRRSDNGKQSDYVAVSFCCIVRLPAARANNTVIIGVVMTSRLVSEGDLWSLVPTVPAGRGSRLLPRRFWGVFARGQGGTFP